MPYNTILIEDQNGVRTITLNRPDRRNAMTPEMQNELIDALDGAADDPECRVVIIAGAGEAFCAGLDIEVLRATIAQSAEQHRADAERVSRLFRTLYELPRPSIAAVHGAAVAGGTGIATICDFTLAAPGVKFGYTESRIGFVPALVSAYLVLQVGDKRARDLLLTARLFSSEEAYALGLVTEVVPAEELTERARSLASSLAVSSSQAMGATKRLLAAQNRAWLDAATAAAMDANSTARETEDFAEGVRAFLDKRRPVWSGRDRI